MLISEVIVGILAGVVCMAAMQMIPDGIGAKLYESIGGALCCYRKERAASAPFSSSASVTAITSNLAARLHARLRTIQFQTALANSQIAIALSEDWKIPKLGLVDNSACYIVGFSNPIRLWAQMVNPPSTDKTAEFQKILELLLSTGAQKFMNAMDPNDGCRPIDVAESDQRGILRSKSKQYGVNLNPTLTHSPLHRCCSGLGWGLRSILPVIEAVDPASLDWTDASGATALHAMCRTASGSPNRIQMLASIDYLLSFIGSINPSHPCFDAVPITDQFITPRLDIARVIAQEYSSIHLPKQISSGILALYSEDMQTVWKDLIALVVQYVF
jgi:hypothetical protein